MKEVLLFSYVNQFALSRQLAAYGINNIGIRTLNNSSIISYIREKTGNLSEKRLINNKEKSYLYTKFLEDDSTYFKGGSYENAKSLSETIDSIRMLITNDEETTFKDKLTNNKLFKEKYEAIYNFYTKYIKYLKDTDSTDTIQEARELIKLNKKIDSDILIIKGEKLSPLNKKLLETCFNSVKEIEYRDLFKVKQNKIDFKHLYKSKGYAHEVSNVFKIIVDNKLPLDTCTIVYTDYNNFYNSIKEYSSLLSLPVTFIDGIPSLEYNAYRFLYLITKLNDGLYGYDVLMNLIKDKSFNYNKLIQDVGITEHIDDFLKELGDLKFTFDKEYNDKIYANYIIGNNSHKEEIKKFKDIFNKGLINLVKEYIVEDNKEITFNFIKDLELYKTINNKDDFDFF